MSKIKTHTFLRVILVKSIKWIIFKSRIFPELTPKDKILHSTTFGQILLKPDAAFRRYQT